MKWFYEFYPEESGQKDDHAGGPAISYGYMADEVLYSGQSDFQKIDIIKNKLYGNILLLDDLMMTNELDEFIYHESLTHVPASSFKGEMKNILIIGGGDGGIVREVLKYKTVEHVDLVEIDPMVIEVSKKYLPTISLKLNDNRVSIHTEDAAKFIKNANDKYYDLILVDSTDPIGPGLALYTEEFYRNCDRALTEEGQFAAQGLAMFVQGREQKKMYTKLKNVFSAVKPYFATIPTYPTALWMFFHANKTRIIPKNVSINKELTELKYLNDGLLRGAYNIPNFASKNLK